MVLYGENRQFSMTHTLNGAIVDRQMGDLQRQSGKGFFVHCVAMVLGGNMHPAILQILDWLNGTAMAEYQLIGISS